MKLVVCLFVFLCVFQTNFVESIDLLNNIQSGVSRAGQSIKCGFHKFGNTFMKHDHGNDPCHSDSEQTENAIKDDDNKPQEGHPTTSSSVDVREKVTSTEPSVVTVPEGKRIIFAKSNCPEGQSDDGAGNCREAF